MTEASICEMEVTGDDLAALVGVTARHIRRFAEAGKIERTGRNRYRLGQAIPALLEEMAGGDKAAELTAERVRKIRAEATMAELELAKAKGLVAPLEQMERAWRHQCTLIRTNMLNLPRRVVSSIVGETEERRIASLLRAEIEQVLRDAAEERVDIPDDEGESDEADE
ncbi:Phage DNA packaging protein, Nu1 subunit of terminase [Azotobacter beijerinckii]|uniref:Phage DNA packaging protein, Nu1 subunit of terminase n=1 Tax=Azotobacter beijerinckii TaxID=170623 RepID=A0A1H6UFP7_9GAMM|nr:hypothetical protein [Azotobacter beijerinckii]SEI86955.1 Phage DNA packaging protein, Nu1 subunit of terminase [Azotobacter beijerinckii]